MYSFKQYLLTRFLGATLVFLVLFYVVTSVLILPMYQDTVADIRHQVSAQNESKLMEQISAARGKISNYLNRTMHELKFLGLTAQREAEKESLFGVNQKFVNDLGLEYDINSNWYQNSSDNSNVVTVWGHLLDSDSQIRPQVLQHLQKYSPVFHEFETIMQLGERKQRAYMVGPEEGSYLRLTPWVDTGGEFDRLYPGHNDQDYWKFFFPGIVEKWKQAPDDFRITDKSNGITLTAPYEDAAGSGMIISLFQPLYDAHSQFDGVVAIDLNIACIVRFISNMKVGGEGVAMMINHDGQIISQSSSVMNRFKLHRHRTDSDKQDSSVRIMQSSLFDSSQYKFKEAFADAKHHGKLTPVACQQSCDESLYMLVESLPNRWIYDGNTVEQGHYDIVFLIPESDLFSLASHIDELISGAAVKTTVIVFTIALLVAAILIIIFIFAIRRLNRALLAVQTMATKIIENQYDLKPVHSQFYEMQDFANAFYMVGGRIRNYTDELVKEKERAEAANRAKSEFLSAMSHELRTPLNSVMGFAQILEVNLADSISETDRLYLQHILRGGSKLSELVDQVLNLEKIQDVDLEPEFAPVDIKAVIDIAINHVQPESMDHNIAVSSDIGQCESQELISDSVMLTLVMTNILKNAVKYNHQGGSVEVTCYVISDEHFRISIRDTGSGIPSDRQQDIFKPFERSGREALSIEGVGLGLTIVERIVDKLHGHVGFSSEENKGSTFWIDLPLIDPRLL